MKKTLLFMTIILLNLNWQCFGQKSHLVTLHINALISENNSNDSLILMAVFKNISDSPKAILKQSFSTLPLKSKLFLEILNQDSLNLNIEYPFDGYLDKENYTIIRQNEEYKSQIKVDLSSLIPIEYYLDPSKYQKRDSIYSMKLQYVDYYKKHKYFIPDTLKSNSIKVKRLMSKELIVVN
jgi:hypothetical protein